jgi:hypothetical protein
MLFSDSPTGPMAPMFQQHVLSVGIRSVDTDCDLSRNRMIQRGRKRCFSVEPALKCLTRWGLAHSSFGQRNSN